MRVCVCSNILPNKQAHITTVSPRRSAAAESPLHENVFTVSRDYGCTAPGGGRGYGIKKKNSRKPSTVHHSACTGTLLVHVEPVLVSCIKPHARAIFSIFPLSVFT